MGDLRMKKKLSLVLCICIITMLAITGCGKVSRESILADLTTNTKEVKSADMNIKMVVDMDATANGTTQNTKINCDLNAQATTDPSVCKIDGKFDMALLGMNQSMGVKSYSIKEEDGSYTTYTFVEGQDKWTKSKVSQDSDKMNELANFKAMEGMFDNFQLADGTTDVNNVKCYKLTGSFEGDNLEKMLGSVETLSGNMKDSLGGLKANVEAYVNAKDMMPVQIKIDFKDSDLAGAMGATEGSTLKVNDFYITLTYNGMNTVDKLEVPEDVKKNAVEGITIQ
jgi:hypothetical protein